MGYLTKSAILKAYEQLSHLSPDPTVQGATQKVSAIRHFMALDSFYKAKGHNCNTREKQDKEDFVEHVGYVCDVCLNFYTPNFYAPLKEHIRDFAVGSNFFSAGQVSASLVNQNKTFEYPKRGGKPLFQIRAGALIRNIEMYRNFDSYIENTKEKVALVLWILRKTNLVGEDSYIAVYKAFENIYSSSLVDLFFSDKETFKKELASYNLKLNDNFYSIRPEDINSMFNDSNIHNQPSLMSSSPYRPYITALQTKPFLLLAGISGTGKSQKVQELAFMSCPKNDEGHVWRDPKSTTPGNYQLIEVKPNWHDSTELLGYYSALSGKYELTDFIRFTCKALLNPDVPFFLCLDEMNLAPVEQYFAEFLSVLETRKKVGGRIESQPLLSKDKFSSCEVQRKVLVKDEGDIIEDGKQYKMEFLYSEADTETINYLKANGLHLPDNLFVIGTVNMDDTTHQFSRKVIDRAFTIEMNGGKMADMFSDRSKTLLEYRDDPVPLAAFRSRYVRAYEVLDDPRFSKYTETIKERIPALLGDSDGTAKENNPESINGILNDTPFRVSYRVQNELVLYLSVLIENAGFPDDIEGLTGESVLAILLEKVLPRVQGEKKQLESNNGSSNILKDLKAFVENRLKPKVEEGQETEPDCLYTKVIKKLEEMESKLSVYYTNFF